MKRLYVLPVAMVCLAFVIGMTGQAGASGAASKAASYPHHGYAASYGYAGYGGYPVFAAGCGGKVKVHNHHPPRGYRCGPNAGGSCSYVYGYATNWRGSHQRVHVWRTLLLPCSAGGAYWPTVMDPMAQPQTPAFIQPDLDSLNAAESLQPPPPALNDEFPSLDNEPPTLNNEPPAPDDDSST